MQFTNLLVVALVAFLAPLVVNLAPRLRIPSPVLEILAGIILGPSVLGLVQVDQPVTVLSLIGLSFLLFVAGLEVDFDRLKGSALRLSLGGYAVSLVLAIAAGELFHAGGFTKAPLLVAIALSATSLGLDIPVLKDAGQLGTSTGQLIVAAASIADFGAVILLSLFFSGASTGISVKLLLLGGLVVVTLLSIMALARAGRAMSTMRVLLRLQDTTAQIRIRFAMLLLIAFVALAERLGLEAILGAFVAGAVLKVTDTDAMAVHPHTELKLDAIGYGFLIPIFFVTSGLHFDAGALFASASTIARVPLFVLALLLVRGAPALLYRRQLGMRKTVAAGLLQATSLPLIVTAVMIGEALGKVTPATGAALIAAGLVSVLVFPSLALGLLREPAPAVPMQQEAAVPTRPAKPATAEP